MPTKELIVVAGPNGAGKSTFVEAYLGERNCPYHCADSIAKEFLQFEPISQQIAAGREFLLRIERQIAVDDDVIVETTMSGRSLQSYLRRAKAAGFTVTIFFVYLDSADTCVARVRQRVRRGGHNVPTADIHRRFTRSLSNFWHIYRKIADYWYVVYNARGDYLWTASGDTDSTIVHQADQFRPFLRLSGAGDD